MYILLIARGTPSPSDPLNGIFEFDQAKALSERKEYKIVYLSVDLRSFRKRRKWGISRYTKEGVEIFNISLPVGPIYSRFFYLIGGFLTKLMYKKIFKKYGPPLIIHSHFTVHSAFAALLKKKHRIPLIITEHSSLVTKEKLSKTTLFWVRRSYPFADIIISVSKSLKKSLLNKFNIESQVIHNIVDNNAFNFHDRDTTDEIFKLISVGSLVYGKGFDVLLEAFSNLKIKNKSLKIIGEGPLRTELEKQVINLGLKENVIFLGKLTRDEINKHFQCSDAFVLASRGETFGVSYIEAMLTGLPVIATRCGGPEEFVTIENGILVPVDDIETVTDAMLFLYENENMYDKNEISNNVRNNFSSEAISYKLIQTYLKLLQDIK